MLSKLQAECRRPRFDFSGLDAIVTGASRGIGRTIADALGAAGARVHAIDVAGPKCSSEFPHRLVALDVADAAAVEAALAPLPAGPRPLVNNARVPPGRSAGQMRDPERAAALA